MFLIHHHAAKQNKQTKKASVNAHFRRRKGRKRCSGFVPMVVAGSGQNVVLIYVSVCNFQTPVVFRPRTNCCVNTVSSYHHHASSMTRKNKLISYLPIIPAPHVATLSKGENPLVLYLDYIPYRIDCTQIEATS